MLATREQERKALKKIEEIVAGLGEASHIGFAMRGVLELAAQNIEEDAAYSLQDRAERAEKARQEAYEKAVSFEKELEAAQRKIKNLEKEIEREQEWKPYVDTGNVSQEDYEWLAQQSDTKFISDDEAKQLIYDWYGFAKENVTIYHSVPKYEVNRHHRLREIGKIDRRPAYNATDWNYIRFDCCGISYELCNDNLSFF